MAFFQDSFFAPNNAVSQSHEASAQRMSYADAAKGSKVTRPNLHFHMLPGSVVVTAKGMRRFNRCVIADQIRYLQQRKPVSLSESRQIGQNCVVEKPLQSPEGGKKNNKSGKKKRNKGGRVKEQHAALAPELPSLEQQLSSPLQSPEMYRGRQPYRTPTRHQNQNQHQNPFPATPSDQQSSPCGDLQLGSTPSQSPHDAGLSIAQFHEIKEKKLTELRTHHEAMQSFLQHFAPAYLALGRCYHNLAFSARNSGYVVEQYKEIASEAFTARPQRELPELVYVFGEASQRLGEAGFLLEGKDVGAAEARLQRVDGLMVEAELRVRFLQGVVGEMWFLVGREEGFGLDDESEERGKERGVLEMEWVRVLPEVCFHLGWGGGGVEQYERFRGSRV